MNAIFFQQIANLNLTGNLQLTISKGAEDNFIVSVILQNEQCGDNAKNLIPPLNFRGTAEELDEGFFGQITAPVQSASALMVDMESFMKQLEEAKKQSVMEKEKAEREKKIKDEKEKKFKEAMTKADELETEGKYREAWSKVPNPADYPQQAHALSKRRKELSDKFEAPSLFGAEQENV